MSERIQRQRVRSEEATVDEAEAVAPTAPVDYEARQGNAEEYVRGFVQKGGQ